MKSSEQVPVPVTNGSSSVPAIEEAKAAMNSRFQIMATDTIKMMGGMVK